MKYRKGQIIQNTCHSCYNPKMKIYRISRSKGEEVTQVLIWCECEKCGAVDDIVREED
ncbi:hypothetical protein [Clostridium sporogenes]|uniref:hypothetical protein n=1 Tax=Clostridium sporogenes TaxID=1509 RepID=UPI0013D65ECC|nr:hypothetical protein [Clostridium sporogenes]